MELGITTFGDIIPDTQHGPGSNAHIRMKQLVEEARVAEESGLDVYAIGEHHRPDFAVSNPEIVLAAIASVTKRIRLSSAVTVLSSVDPVRIFQNFASLDLLSDGRAEIIAGRGSFIESFPLFGKNLDDYETLFAEHLELLIQLNKDEVITWKGHHRPNIDARGIYPRPVQSQIPIWLGVGGTPTSAARAGTLKLPMILAILGGHPARFQPFANIYRKAAAEAGHDLATLPLGINTHFHIAENSQQAADELFPTYSRLMNRIGRERGWSPIDRNYYDEIIQNGPLFVGSPAQIVDKVLQLHEIFGHTRYLAHITAGDIPHKNILKSIELFGTKVAPEVKKALAK